VRGKALRAVVSDFLRERGFGEERINLFFAVKGEEDAKELRESYMREKSEELLRKRRSQPIPSRIPQRDRQRWCETHGGHTISGFLDYWCCKRCDWEERN